MNLNRVELAGNLTKDPELTYLESGTAKGKFSIAVNSQFKTRDGELKKQTDYFNIECFGSTAENCSKYLCKGRPVFIEGKLKVDSWEKDGKKQYMTKIIADRVHFLGSAKKED